MVLLRFAIRGLIVGLFLPVFGVADDKPLIFSPKLPAGYELLSAFVSEDCPDALDKQIEFGKRIAQEKGANWGVQLGGPLVFGDFVWKPVLSKDAAKVRIFVPYFTAGRLTVLVGGKEVWSLTESTADALSPELELPKVNGKLHEVVVKADKVDPFVLRGPSNVLLIAPARAPSALRILTDRTGIHKTVAEFVDLKGGTIKLRKKNGTIVSIPVEKLSAVDQLHAKEQSLAVAKPPTKAASQAKADAARESRRAGPAASTASPKMLPKLSGTEVESLRTALSDGDRETVKKIVSTRTIGDSLKTHGATRGGPLITAVVFGWGDVVELMLAQGANVNRTDSLGWTSLDWAVANNNQPIAELLIAHGANVNTLAFDGDTPLQRAVRMKHNGLSELLRKSGATK